MTSIFDLYKPSSWNFTGDIAEYLVEHKQPGANITNLDDTLWWSVITITTIGYGDYTPISPLGRTIAVIVMFAGIGIAVTLVGIISQNRVQRMQERLKSKAEGKAGVFANESKVAIKDKIERIEKLTEEDFDGLVIMMKSLRLTLLEESKDVCKCSRCGYAYRSKPKFCSSCGLALTVYLEDELPSSRNKQTNFNRSRLLTSISNPLLTRTEGILDKEITSYDECFDSFRLSMMFWK